jgi:putative sterol carrier protein
MTGRLTVNGDDMTGQIAGMSGAIVKLRRQR